MPIKITDWVPKPGKPLPIPTIEDDSKLIPEADVRQIKQYLEVRSRQFSQAPDAFLVSNRPWRAAIMSSYLREKGILIAIFKHWAAQPVPNPRKIVILGPYVGCFKGKEPIHQGLIQ